MYTVEECRRRAEECERAAGGVNSPKQRETMLTIARIWRELAEEREQKSRSSNAA